MSREHEICSFYKCDWDKTNNFWQLTRSPKFNYDKAKSKHKVFLIQSSVPLPGKVCHAVRFMCFLVRKNIFTIHKNIVTIFFFPFFLFVISIYCVQMLVVTFSGIQCFIYVNILCSLFLRKLKINQQFSIISQTASPI